MARPAARPAAADASSDASSDADGVVLAKALFRAADACGLSRRTLAAMTGLSEATLSRAARGRPIDPATKEGELALGFLRAFRSLDALVGGEAAQARAWMHAENRHLGGVPADLVTTAAGLFHVVEYLDALRGRG